MSARPGKPGGRGGRRVVPARTGAWRWPLVVAFAALLVYAYIIGRLPVQLLFVYGGASVLAAIMYAFDKSAAVTQRSRTPENKLHLVSLLGGWPGALLAQGQFRHKTGKREFQVVFWVTVALNCAGLVWVVAGGGGCDFLLRTPHGLWQIKTTEC